MTAGILIVDDEVIVAESTRAMLGALGHRTTGIALSEAEAWEAVGRDRPDLVLVDINLGPGGDGISLAEGLRQRHGLPVVYVTAYSDDATLQRAKVSHPFGYIVKPFGTQDLKVAVEIALHNHGLETQLRQREQALRESQSRERAILENIADPAWMRGRDGRFVAVNRAWCAALGISEEEGLGKTAADLLPPPTAERFDAQDSLVMDTGAPWHGEEQVGIEGVEARWFETYKAPIKHPAGSVSGIVGIARDITSRKRTEEALRESEQRFRSVVESSPDGIFIQTRGVFAYLNPAAVELFGAGDEQSLVGTPVPARFHPDDRAFVAARIKGLNQDRRPATLAEERVLRPDGAIVHVEVSAVPFTHGGEAGALVFIRDISERRRAAEAEQASTARLHAALESMTDAVFISDAEGRFVEFNEAFATFHKFAGKDDCAKTLAEYPDFLDVYLANGELAPLDQWAVPRALRGETVTNAEYALHRRDTGERWVGSYSFAPVRDEGGAIVGSVVVGRDITEAKQTQKALDRARRVLEEAESLAHLGSWEFVAETGATVWSEEECRIYGLAPRAPSPSYEELLDRYFAPDDALLLDRTFRDCADRGAAFELEHRIVRADGEVRWVRELAHPRFDEEGRLLGYIGATLDITDQRASEQDLREAHELVNTVFESSPLPIGIYDRSGILIDANPKAYRMFGTTPEHVVGKLRLADAPGHEAPEIWEHLERGEPVAVQAAFDTVLRSDDTDVPSRAELLLLTTPVPEALCKRVGYIVQVMDISDLRRARAALERTNRDLRAVSACNEAMLRATDESALLQEVCRIVCDEAGYRMAWVGFARDDEEKSVEPVAWSGISDAGMHETRVSWGETERGHGPIGRAIRSGRATICQDVETDPDYRPWRAYAARGAYRSVIALPLNNEAGVRFGALAIYAAEPDAFTEEEEIRLMEQMAGDLAFGVTALRTRAKRDAAEQELRKLSRAVEQSPASIVITDANGAIEYVNPKFSEVTGYTAAEACGLNPRVLKSGKTRPEEYRRLWRTITAGGEWRGEFLNRRKNGEEFLEAASISPILDAQGKITHYVALKEDITERRKLEEGLRQAQKLEAIGQLAGGVAHDFNNILAAILMNLELLKAEPGLAEKTRSGLVQLEREAHRAVTLTRQLLLFSRRQIMDATIVDIDESVKGITKMLGRLLGEDVVLTFVPSSASSSVLADAGMVDQILMNLCINARDAMPGGGRLTVRADTVAVTPEQAEMHPGARPGPFVCLSVADEGCGMDEETQKRIFEPFFTTKEVGKGTGLGLATVYGIVQQHNGWIEVESAAGQGSTFRIYLPAAQAEPGADAGEAPTAESAGSECILLVEDDQALLFFVSQALRSRGYVVLEAKDGGEAEHIWSQHHDQIDLLVSDMVMPGGETGLEIAERLRHENADLPVVLCSGYTGDRSPSHLASAHGMRFLQKPFNLSTLADAVRASLDERSGPGR